MIQFQNVRPPPFQRSSLGNAKGQSLERAKQTKRLIQNPSTTSAGPKTATETANERSDRSGLRSLRRRSIRDRGQRRPIQVPAFAASARNPPSGWLARGRPAAHPIRADWLALGQRESAKVEPAAAAARPAGARPARRPTLHSARPVEGRKQILQVPDEEFAQLAPQPERAKRPPLRNRWVCPPPDLLCGPLPKLAPPSLLARAAHSPAETRWPIRAPYSGRVRLQSIRGEYVNYLRAKAFVLCRARSPPKRPALRAQNKEIIPIPRKRAAPNQNASRVQLWFNFRANENEHLQRRSAGRIWRLKYIAFRPPSPLLGPIHHPRAASSLAGRRVYITAIGAPPAKPPPFRSAQPGSARLGHDGAAGSAGAICLPPERAGARSSGLGALKSGRLHQVSGPPIRSPAKPWVAGHFRPPRPQSEPAGGQETKQVQAAAAAAR